MLASQCPPGGASKARRDVENANGAPVGGPSPPTPPPRASRKCPASASIFAGASLLRKNSIVSMRSPALHDLLRGRGEWGLADILLRLTKMIVELGRAFGEAAHVFQQFADLGLDLHGGLVAHARRTSHDATCIDLDRHRAQQRGRNSMIHLAADAPFECDHRRNVRRRSESDGFGGQRTSRRCPGSRPASR